MRNLNIVVPKNLKKEIHNYCRERYELADEILTTAESGLPSSKLYTVKRVNGTRSVMGHQVLQYLDDGFQLIEPGIGTPVLVSPASHGVSTTKYWAMWLQLQKAYDRMEELEAELAAKKKPSAKKAEETAE